MTAAAAMTGALAPAAAGQTGAADGTRPARMEGISVTATRNPTAAFEFPGMVTVLGRERIRALQPSTPDDVLRFVPNVEFNGGPRRTGETPSIRGFDGPDVIVTIDGARQNFDSGHDGRFFLDPSFLAAAEVLRGPASSLYGSGGTGGVIAFRTVRAADFLSGTETAGATVSTGYQSANRERHGTTIAYARPWQGLDLIAGVTRRDSGSIELGDGTELDRTDDDILSGLAKLGWRFARHHDIEASFQRFGNDAEEPNNAQGLGSADLVEKELRADSWRLAYGYHDPGNDLIDLDLLAYYTDFKADELRLDANGAGPQGELLKRDVDTLGFRLDSRSRWRAADSLGVTFTYGAEAYRDEQDGEAAAGARDGVPDAQTEFAGIFGQAELRWAGPFGPVPGDLLIIPGVRYDHYTSSSTVADDNEDDELSPRIGVSYLPTPWSVLFASYATAFRAPTINELYLSGVHFQIPIGPGITNRFVANPDLRPQRTETLEFGGGLSFDDLAVPGDVFEIKATHFRIEGEDFIDLQVNQPAPFIDCIPFIPGACDGTTTSANVPDARLDGNEIEASYEQRRFRIAVGYSTIDGENTRTGAKLGVLAPDQLTVDGALKLPEYDAAIGWRLLAASRFDKTDDPALVRDGYTVHDVHLAWAPSSGRLRGFRLDLGVDNVFDTSYARVFSDAKEAGRNYKAAVSYAVAW